MRQRRTLRAIGPVLALALLGAGCGGDADPAAEPAATSPAATSSSGIGQVAPGTPFVGKVVTVSGRVEDLLGIDAFRLTGEGWQGEPLKVVDVADVAVTDDQAVQVTGVVQIFDRDLLEKKYQVTLAAVGLDQWAGKQVIVASQVRTLGR